MVSSLVLLGVNTQVKVDLARNFDGLASKLGRRGSHECEPSRSNACASKLLFKLKIKQTLAGLVVKKLNGAGQNVNVLVGLAGGATATLANLNDKQYENDPCWP